VGAGTKGELGDVLWHTQYTAAVMEEYLVNTVVGLPCQSKRALLAPHSTT